ncbi:hypothetical protein Tco_1169535, partial [Tanacetum coccineum]
GDVERTLGNVLERLKVLESEENATLKKGLTEAETKLAWARMERDITERRFYLDMVCIGAILKPPSDEEDTERSRKKSKKSSSDGARDLLSHVNHLVTLSRLVYHLIMPPKAMFKARMVEFVRDQVNASMVEFVVNMNREAGGAGAGDAGAGGAGV